MKRALSGMRPPTRQQGEPALARVLFEALARAAVDAPDALTHGFHAWPARMHRSIAATVLDGVPHTEGLVVDPFCGGGTVPIEARVRGRGAVAVDLSPLALRVTEVKTDVRSAGARAAFLEAARAVAAASRERVKAKVRVRAPLSRAEAARWAPHVLLELAGLREEIGAVKHRADRRALEVVLSAILTKVSRARSDTDGREQGKRIGRYLSTELFARKASELAERWAALEAAVAKPTSPLSLFEHDARALHEVVRPKSAGLVLTSPPYGGTYDYASHHAERMPWLGLDDRALHRGELGARRRTTPASWDAETSATLAALARALAVDGTAVLLVGDAELGGVRVDAGEQLAHLAPSAGLRVRASASAPRDDHRAGPDRREHLVALASA